MTRNKFTVRRNRNDDYEKLSGLRSEHGEKLSKPFWNDSEYGENLNNYPEREEGRRNPWKKPKPDEEEAMWRKMKRGDEASFKRKNGDDWRNPESDEQDRMDFETEKSRYLAEKLEFQTKKVLAEENLPVSFAKLLCGQDEEETLENIAVFKKEFSKAIEAALSEKMKGSTPKTASGAVDYDPFLNGFGY